MPEIHPTAIIEGDVDLADDVVIGPHCVLKGPITLASGNRLIGGVWLTGPLTMGESNICYPGACLGFAPQDYKWDPRKAGAGVIIGSANIFREGVTIHRATSDETPTTIGNSNFWMANSHAGHDCQIASHCVFTNTTLLAGHVRVDERVVTGGHSGVHQFCRVGRGVMLAGGAITTRDVLPFFMLTGHNVAGSLNVVGLRRSGMPADEIEDVRWVYKTLYRRGLSFKAAREALKDRAERPLVREYLEFIDTSNRGICAGTSDRRRNPN